MPPTTLAVPGINRAELLRSSVEVVDAVEECLLLWSDDLWASAYQRHTDQSARSFNIEVDGASLSIKQTPATLLQPGVTGAVVWDGGVMMARCLEHWVDSGLCRLKGARVIDLGSGTGLAGIAAAALGAHAALTDQNFQLKLLKENAAANCSADAPLKGSISIHELDWTNELHIAELREPHAHLLLAADCVFNEEIVPGLLSAITGLSGRETLTLISLELRSDETHEAFLKLAVPGFLVWRLGDEYVPECVRSARAKIYMLEPRGTADADK